MIVKFTGCKYLDFEDNYVAKKQIIFLGENKVFWLREVSDPGLPSMVQFCKKRGRLNAPVACLNELDACCTLYEDYNHEVVVTDP